MISINKSPLISVCIPCYKHPQLIERCLESVLMQTYKNYEVIITDDSPDYVITELIKDKFMDPRIVYKKNVHQLGSPKNWNESISLSKGDFIKIMHHDDWFATEDALQEFVSAAVSSGADFVCSNCVDHFPGRTSKHKIPLQIQKNWKKKPYLILFSNFIGDPSVTMYKRDSTTQLFFDINTIWFVDTLFYYEYVSARKISFINKYLLNVTAGSETQITNNHINSKIVISEFVYLVNKHGLDQKNSFLTKLSLIELLKRYGIKSKEEMNMLLPEPLKLTLPYFLLKIPVSNQVFNIFKHLLLFA